MKRTFLIVFSLVWMCGCDQKSLVVVTPPPVVPPGYPATARFTEERYNRYVATWLRFATAYNVPLDPPPVDSILMIPTQWISTIDLFPDRPDTVTLGESQTRLYQLVDKWPDLFNVRLPELRETNGSNQGSFYHFMPEKRYPYGPVTSNSMRHGLSVVIDHAGRITSLTNNCAPTLELPFVVNIDSSRARSILMGKKLYYHDWDGEQTLILSDQTMKRSEIAASLVPRWSDAPYARRIALEYRRTWKISTPIFDVYVDAITGEDLNYAEQNVIF